MDTFMDSSTTRSCDVEKTRAHVWIRIHKYIRTYVNTIDVLLTVLLSIFILVIIELDAQN